MIHGIEFGLYMYSLYGQTSPDTIDPEHVNNGPPWYITKSCSIASTGQLKGYCTQAKASFYVTCVMLALFAIHIIYAVFSSFPTKTQKLHHASKRLTSSPQSIHQEKFADPSPTSEHTADQQWELQQLGMQQLPRTPGTTGGMKSPLSSRSISFGQGLTQEMPMTPRSTAFTQLGGVAVPAAYKPLHQSWVSPAIPAPYTPPQVQSAYGSPQVQTSYTPPQVQTSYTPPQVQTSYTPPQLQTTSTPPQSFSLPPAPAKAGSASSSIRRDLPLRERFGDVV